MIDFDKLFEFVAEKHGDQKRKYTFEPYTVHLKSVADLVEQYEPGNDIAKAAALCHDLFEDTDCLIDELKYKLRGCGFGFPDFAEIIILVGMLSDEFTHEHYPSLNREKRKQREAERLWKIHPIAQTVKYADLIDNTSSIIKHDPHFAVTYLKEKERILAGMTAGNTELKNLAMETLQQAQIDLIDRSMNPI